MFFGNIVFVFIVQLCVTCLALGSVDRILKNFTTSSTSSDSETNFDSGDPEINFIREYEIEAEQDVLCESPQSSSLTSSDNEAAAYADDPLADTVWTSNYQKQEDADEKLEQRLKDRLEGNVELREWCKCGNCNIGSLQNISECYCCSKPEGYHESLKSDLVGQDLGSDVELTSVTAHPGFQPVCNPLMNGTKLKSIESENRDDAVLNHIEGLNNGVKSRLYEADIVLTDEDKQLVDQREEGDANRPEGGSNMVKRNAVRNRQKLWKTRVLPYRISPALYRVKSVIIAAMKEFHRNTCLRFRRRRKEPHWIYFVKRPGCWSSVGQKISVPGPQLLSIGPGCDRKGIVMHELMHAAGFWHEQSRTDRNKYVEILWENVAKGQAHNFNKYPHGKLDSLGAMYDFQSLMHYGSHAFSKNGKRTLKSIKYSGSQFGQRKGFSETDILQLNALYDCKTESSQPWSSWTKFGPCNDKCQRVRQRFCTTRYRMRCPGAGAYGIQKQLRTCSLNECYAPVHGHWGRWSSWSSCNRACGPSLRARRRLCDDPRPRYGGKKCSGGSLQTEWCTRRKC